MKFRKVSNEEEAEKLRQMRCKIFRIMVLNVKRRLNERILRANILDSKECETLIFERIKERIKYPNYYQITSFINLLGTQLKKFSQLYFLSPQYFNDFGIPPEDIRSYTIETFIFFTKYFIEGGYINLVNNQTRYFWQMARNFDENRDNEEAIKESMVNAIIVKKTML